MLFLFILFFVPLSRAAEPVFDRNRLERVTVSKDSQPPVESLSHFSDSFSICCHDPLTHPVLTARYNGYAIALQWNPFASTLNFLLLPNTMTIYPSGVITSSDPQDSAKITTRYFKQDGNLDYDRRTYYLDPKQKFSCSVFCEKDEVLVCNDDEIETDTEITEEYRRKCASNPLPHSDQTMLQKNIFYAYRPVSYKTMEEIFKTCGVFLTPHIIHLISDYTHEGQLPTSFHQDTSRGEASYNQLIPCEGSKGIMFIQPRTFRLYYPNEQHATTRHSVRDVFIFGGNHKLINQFNLHCDAHAINHILGSGAGTNKYSTSEKTVYNLLIFFNTLPPINEHANIPYHTKNQLAMYTFSHTATHIDYPIKHIDPKSNPEATYTCSLSQISTIPPFLLAANVHVDDIYVLTAYGVHRITYNGITLDFQQNPLATFPYLGDLKEWKQKLVHKNKSTCLKLTNLHTPTNITLSHFLINYKRLYALAKIEVDHENKIDFSQSGFWCLPLSPKDDPPTPRFFPHQELAHLIIGHLSSDDPCLQQQLPYYEVLDQSRAYGHPNPIPTNSQRTPQSPEMPKVPPHLSLSPATATNNIHNPANNLSVTTPPGPTGPAQMQPSTGQETESRQKMRQLSLPQRWRGCCLASIALVGLAYTGWKISQGCNSYRLKSGIQ